MEKARGKMMRETNKRANLLQKRENYENYKSFIFLFFSFNKNGHFHVIVEYT